MPCAITSILLLLPFIQSRAAGCWSLCQPGTRGGGPPCNVLLQCSIICNIYRKITIVTHTKNKCVVVSQSVWLLTADACLCLGLTRTHVKIILKSCSVKEFRNKFITMFHSTTVKSLINFRNKPHGCKSCRVTANCQAADRKAYLWYVVLQVRRSLVQIPWSTMLFHYWGRSKSLKPKYSSFLQDALDKSAC